MGETKIYVSFINKIYVQFVVICVINKFAELLLCQFFDKQSDKVERV